MTDEEKLLSGYLFCPGDAVLRAQKLKTHKLNLDYNRLYEDETAARDRILHEMLGALGEGSFLQGPICFHYGIHTRIGKRFFANFNLTVQDDAPVTIGDDCNFGPNVTIVTPLHPMLAEERKALADETGTPRRLCWAKPVHIGSNCWFGANVLVCPGVSIGENCVIGAGSVVLHDVPAGSFAAGNPCRVIRPLSEQDRMCRHPELFAPVSDGD